MLYTNKYYEGSLGNSKILLTGGAGFIGSNIVRYLMQHGIGKLVVLDNLSTGCLNNIRPFLDQPNFEFIQGDIRDIEVCKNAMQNIELVCHQAALGSVPRSINDPSTTNEVNILGHLNILIAAKENKIGRVVYAASSSTYGDSHKLPKVEHEIGKPLSPYAITKYVNELYADVFQRIYGLDTIGLRYFNVFGPFQNPNGAYAAVIPKFIQSIIDNQSPTINGDGSQTRDFTFVENAVQANIRALFTTNKSALNQVYNIAYSERTSLKDLYYILLEFANKDLPPIFGPNRVGDIWDSLADIGKAREFLAYNPNYNVRNGLNHTFQWFSENQDYTFES